MTATETTRLLKANDLRNLGSKVAFNYEDLRQRCDNYIDQIRAQAQQILIDAQAEADQLRAQAKQQGREEGLRTGREEGLKDQEQIIAAAANEQSARQLNTTLPALKSAATALDHERNRWLATWQNIAVKLSVSIAEKLLRHELNHHPELVKDAVLEALELAAGNPQIQLRMNPADVEFLGDWCPKIVSVMSPAGVAEIVSDPDISAGGCVVQTKHGVIDAQVETKLARIAQELLDDDSSASISGGAGG